MVRLAARFALIALSIVGCFSFLLLTVRPAPSALVAAMFLFSVLLVACLDGFAFSLSPREVELEAKERLEKGEYNVVSWDDVALPKSLKDRIKDHNE